MKKIKPTMVTYSGMDEIGSCYVFKRDDQVTYKEPHSVWVEKFDNKSGEITVFAPAGTTFESVMSMLKGLFHPQSNFSHEMRKAFGDKAVLKAASVEWNGKWYTVTGYEDEKG